MRKIQAGELRINKVVCQDFQSPEIQKGVGMWRDLWIGGRTDDERTGGRMAQWPNGTLRNSRAHGERSALLFSIASAKLGIILSRLSG